MVNQIKIPNGKFTSVDSLRKLKTPYRSSTDTHQTVPHVDVCDHVLLSIHSTPGVFVDTEPQISITEDHAKMFFQVEVKQNACNKTWTDEGVRYLITARNDHAKDFSMNVGGKELTLVCNNGLELTRNLSDIKTKHTKHDGERWRNVIEKGVAESLVLFEDMQALSNQYSCIKIETTNKEHNMMVHHILVEAMKRRIISSSGIQKVLKHWTTPEHDEFKCGTLNGLRQAFTSNERGKNSFTHARRMSDMSKLFSEYFSVDDINVGISADAVEKRAKYGYTPTSTAYDF